MVLQYVMKIVPALLLLLSGLLIAGDPSAKRRIVGMLANWGMANDDTKESIEASASIVVRVLYVGSLFFFLWLGIFFYHNHRKLTVHPFGEDTTAPYHRPNANQAPSDETQPSSDASSADKPIPAPKGGPAHPYTTTLAPRPEQQHIAVATYQVGESAHLL